MDARARLWLAEMERRRAGVGPKKPHLHRPRQRLGFALASTALAAAAVPVLGPAAALLVLLPLPP